MDENSMAAGAVGATDRKTYYPPRLSVLGDIGSLTESGSGQGNEAMRFVGCTNDPNVPGPMC